MLRFYAAIVRPLLRGKWRADIFLLVVAVLPFGALATFYTRDVTVKLLPFDNKSELSVMIDMPGGAFLGIMLGQWLFNAPFSAPSMIGLIAHASITVRNSILLVDSIRHADPEGRITVDILIVAGATRFKPILLTAIAAAIRAAVILTDAILQGLALSLLFGLLTSTALSVLVTPAIYRVFET